MNETVNDAFETVNETFKTVNAFDAAAIHAGNKGREIDHASVAPRVELLLAGMTLAQKINEIRGRQT